MANLNQQFSKVKRWFLGIFGIIESAFKIPLRNPSFIILTLIASFPLFYMTFVPRLPYDYQPTLIMEAFDLLQSLAEHSNPLISDMAGYLPLTIQILGLYLFYFVSFLIAVTTIYAASTIYTSSERSKPGLLILLRNSAAKIRSTSMFLFLYVSFLDGLSQYALFYWIYEKPLLPLGCPNRYYRAMNSVVSGLLYAKWVDYRAWWNLSIVVSILEDKSGLEAMSASSELTKRKRLRGFILMLVYSVLTFQLPTVQEEWTFPLVFVYYFLHSSFFCLGKVMRWVDLTIYYYVCKSTYGR